MEVLTSDSRAKSQLSILLRELGYAASFHGDVGSLEAVLSANVPKQPVLIDLSEDIAHEALGERFDSNISFIGFQFLTSAQGATVHANAKFYSTSVVLPTHAERAKARLKNTLKPLRAPGGLASSRRPISTIIKGLSGQKSRPPFSFRSAASASTQKATERPPRYLVCESAASSRLLQRIRARESSQVACLFLGEDGAEFELVAREVNFQVTGDKTPMHMVQPDELSIDELEKLEREASRARTVLHVYVGRTDDYAVEALSQLGLFIDFLNNLRNPHLRIYLGHAYGSEEFFRAGLEEVFKRITVKMPTLKLPSMAERPEDISDICHTAVGMLRAAHPFLFVQHIATEAIDYLVSSREELSYRKLIRILRNSISLSQKPVLGMEDVKNYGESDLTNQHLLESMADEKFFPMEESANF